jgi:hypothetical protein
VEKFIAVPFCGNALTVVRDVLARECAEVRDGTSERA